MKQPAGTAYEQLASLPSYETARVHRGSWRRALSVFLCIGAGAQEGDYGVGHGNWHQDFYSKLRRNGGKGSCCNMMDCRPTQSRMVGDHYEVKVDDEWVLVPVNTINNVVAPDGGAHVCAPDRKAVTRACYIASSSRQRAVRPFLRERATRRARKCRRQVGSRQSSP